MRTGFFISTTDAHMAVSATIIKVISDKENVLKSITIRMSTSSD